VRLLVIVEFAKLFSIRVISMVHFINLVSDTSEMQGFAGELGRALRFEPEMLSILLIPFQMTQPKCAIVGDPGVGKTFSHICHTYGGFPTDYIPTVFDGYVPTLRVGDQKIHLLFWDTDPEKEYKKHRQFCYPRTDAFILYSVSHLVNRSKISNISNFRKSNTITQTFRTFPSAEK
jgi:hypothetical protein